MIRLLLLAICLWLSTFGAPRAAMYSEAELAPERNRLKARIAELHERIARPSYLPPDAGWLSEVPIATPDLGPGGHPLGFATDGRRVFMPLVGLKFLEDLTMAYAWRYHEGRSLEPFDVYLAMLRYRPEADWPGGRYLDPLEAFAVPALVWERKRAVGELGTALRNEAWAFILAHELGHIHSRHSGNEAVSPKVSRANERAADAFALEVFERTGEIPMGALLFFQATAVFGPNPADFSSDEAYGAWQQELATHPVNAERLRAMAETLQDRARRTPDQAEALGFIGEGLLKIAETLADPELQRFVVERGRESDPRGLSER